MDDWKKDMVINVERSDNWWLQCVWSDELTVAERQPDGVDIAGKEECFSKEIIVGKKNSYFYNGYILNCIFI